MNSEQGFQLGDLTRILKRRFGLIAGVSGAIVLLAVLVSAWMPDEYESKAILLIEPQTISSELVESNLEDTDLNSRLHLIQMQILSRPRLSKIIDDLDVYPDESKDYTREEIIERMRDEITVVPLLSELEARAGIKNQQVQINTFQLAFRHRDRKASADVANRLARSFVDEHIRERTRASSDTSEFIDTELTRLAEQIAVIESRIAEVKGANTGALPEDLPANQRLHERILGQIRDAQRDLAIAESDEAFYGQQVITGATDFYKFRGNEMTPERRLELLRLQLSEYQSRRYTEKHPDMISARAEIAELEAKLAQEDSSKDDSELSIAQQNAKSEQSRAALRAAATRGELERLRAQVDAIESNLANTPRVAEQLAALEREHEHLFNSYQDYSGKRLEASVAADMERRQKGEKFRVLEEAVPEEEVASPNRPVIFVMSVVLGLALGLGAALLAEAGDGSFHDPRLLQERLGIPVLASVPNVLLASDRAVARRRRFRAALAASMVTGVVLVAAVAGNWYVNGLPGVLTELTGGAEEEADAPAAE